MKTIFKTILLAAAAGTLVQCASTTSEFEKEFSLFENQQEVKALRAKAEAGDSLAQYELGNKYWREYVPFYYKNEVRGGGQPKASEKAMEWWEKAAFNGNVDAMHEIAFRYVWGDYGVGLSYDGNEDERRLKYTQKKDKALFWADQVKKHSKDKKMIETMDRLIKDVKNGTNSFGECG